MRIVSLNGFRIPGIEYPRKSYGEFEDLKNPDTEMLYFDAPDNFLHFQEQTYENDLVGVQHARDAWKLEQTENIDAIVIACNGEPGVKAARELCGTLVMGSACAAMHVASMLGRKFVVMIDHLSEAHRGREGIEPAPENYKSRTTGKPREPALGLCSPPRRSTFPPPPRIRRARSS